MSLDVASARRQALLCFVEDDGATLDDAIARLCVQDRERLTAISASARRREFVLARRLVARACEDALGGHGWRLVGERGRRPLALADDGRTHAAVSLSHSRGAIAFVVADAPGVAIGCDLEQVRARPASTWRRLADPERSHPVFSARDREWILTHTGGALADPAREARLALLWTCKEAVAKADGAGIFKARLPSLQFDPDELGAALHAASSSALGAVRGEQRWYLQVRRLPRYWLAVASSEPLCAPLRALAMSELRAGIPVVP